MPPSSPPPRFSRSGSSCGSRSSSRGATGTASTTRWCTASWEGARSSGGSSSSTCSRPESSATCAWTSKPERPRVSCRPPGLRRRSSSPSRSSSAHRSPDPLRIEVAWGAVPVVDPPIAASFVSDHSGEITAVLTVILAFVLARVVDRSLIQRGRKLSEVVAGGSLSPVADTRLRLVRRLVFATIIVLGFALALAQFPSVKRVATGVLASSAVLGLVIGFAARQTLANGVAGILLAITQPIRIGDLITFEGETGTVEDIRLTYTYVRADDGRRIVIPNERLAQNTVENHTIVDPRVRVEASVWIPREVDTLKALAALRSDDDVEVSVAEIDKDGVRLVAGTWARDASERGAIAAGLRASCLERLHSAGLSSAVAE